MRIDRRMNVQNNNLQTVYKNYIESQKAQQAKLEADAKNVTNPEVRKYLEASNKVMNQLNQLDEFVLSTTTPKKKPQGFFEKVKAFFKK